MYYAKATIVCRGKRFSKGDEVPESFVNAFGREYFEKRDKMQENKVETNLKKFE